MLEEIKKRLGIQGINVYDDELESLIDAALADMKASGVTTDMAEAVEPDGRVLLCVTMFVKANYGDDRTNSNLYTQRYRENVFRLCQEEGGS